MNNPNKKRLRRTMMFMNALGQQVHKIEQAGIGIGV